MSGSTTPSTPPTGGSIKIGPTGKASTPQGRVRGSKLGPYKAPSQEALALVGQAVGGLAQQWATTVPGFGAFGGGLGGFAQRGPSLVSGNLDGDVKGLLGAFKSIGDGGGGGSKGGACNKKDSPEGNNDCPSCQQGPSTQEFAVRTEEPAPEEPNPRDS